MSNYIIVGGELYHYGVPGMRWGHRKARPVSAERARMQSAKAAYKKSNKEYSKAYNKAYNYSSRHMISQWANGHKRAESDRRWGDAYDKAVKANSDKAAYKQAKKEYKQTDDYKARRNRAIKIGAAAAGTALAAYGAYKLNNFVKDKNCQIAYEEGRKYAKKKFQSEQRMMAEIYQKGGNYKTSIDTGRYAREAADSASKENFRTAAKNVVNYGRKNKTLRVEQGPGDVLESVIESRRKKR